jgi:hypothetical protein
MSSDLALLPIASPSPTELEFAIRVENLSKSYQIYDRPEHRLWQSLLLNVAS